MSNKMRGHSETRIRLHAILWCWPKTSAPDSWGAIFICSLTCLLWCAGFDLPDERKGHILVELKTANAVKLVQYSTSNRVIALPTTQLNARRWYVALYRSIAAYLARHTSKTKNTGLRKSARLNAIFWTLLTGAHTLHVERIFTCMLLATVC